MSEYMGMVYGTYDAKKGGKKGFQPGGGSLHSVDTPHGPDAATFLAASNAELKPEKFEGGLAFMFESTYMLRLTDYALHCEHNDADYWKCWQQMPKLFDPSATPTGN
jgi:homogentisate 1,2-dioxygenase